MKPLLLEDPHDYSGDCTHTPYDLIEIINKTSGCGLCAAHIYADILTTIRRFYREKWLTHAIKKEDVYLNYTTIADMSRYPVKSVTRACKKLEDMGILTILMVTQNRKSTRYGGCVNPHFTVNERALALLFKGHLRTLQTTVNTVKSQPDTVQNAKGIASVNLTKNERNELNSQENITEAGHIEPSSTTLGHTRSGSNSFDLKYHPTGDAVRPKAGAPCCITPDINSENKTSNKQSIPASEAAGNAQRITRNKIAGETNTPASKSQGVPPVDDKPVTVKIHKRAAGTIPSKITPDKNLAVNGPRTSSSIRPVLAPGNDDRRSSSPTTTQKNAASAADLPVQNAEIPKTRIYKRGTDLVPDRKPLYSPELNATLEELMDYWNALRFTRTHKDQKTKAYKDSKKMLSALLSGRVGGQAKAKYKVGPLYCKANGIPLEPIKLTVADIKEAMDRVDWVSNPKNGSDLYKYVPKSLSACIFNDYNNPTNHSSFILSVLYNDPTETDGDAILDAVKDEEIAAVAEDICELVYDAVNDEDKSGVLVLDKRSTKQAVSVAEDLMAVLRKSNMRGIRRLELHYKNPSDLLDEYIGFIRYRRKSLMFATVTPAFYAVKNKAFQSFVAWFRNENRWDLLTQCEV